MSHFFVCLRLRVYVPLAAYTYAYAYTCACACAYLYGSCLCLRLCIVTAAGMPARLPVRLRRHTCSAVGR